MRILLVLLVLVGCGGGGSPAVTAPVTPPVPIVEVDSGYLAEQTDYYDGVLWHRYFRWEGKIWYARSVDGLNFQKYPDPLMDGLFPVLVEDGEFVWLIVNQGSSYNLFDISVKTKPFFIKTVLTGDFFNVSAAVVEGRWHMLVEVGSGKDFEMRYTWSDWPLDFNVNMESVVFRTAGNPSLRYFPERGEIMALYGFHGDGLWKVKAARFDFKEWKETGFVLSGDVHIADPDWGVGKESGILTVGYSQDSVKSYRYTGSRLDLYDAIVLGKVELEDLGVTP
jgi:hypothetical protein